MTRGPLVAAGRGLIACDAVCLAAVVMGAELVGDVALPTAIAQGSAIALLMLGIFALVGAYLPAALRPQRAAFLRLLVVSAVTAALVLALYLAGVESRGLLAAIALGGLLTAVIAPIAAAYVKLLERGWVGGRILLIGDGDVAEQIAEGVKVHERLGLKLVGFVSDAQSAHFDAAHGRASLLRPWLGPIEHFEKLIREFSIDRVVVVMDESGAKPIEDALIAARLSGIVVESGTDCFEWMYGRLPLDATARQLFLEGPGFSPPGYFEIAKRAIDIVFSFIGLVAAAPLIALAAGLIRAESPGPVFFRQRRLARHGRSFGLWKLRSMYDDAESDGPSLAAHGDSRVTRVGRLLRRTRIDELPQLWNVLRGDMSIVGPRPERPEYYDEIVGRYPLFRHRLAIRPGLTGWAQVKQGYVNDWDGFGIKLSYDLFYIKRRCIGLDAQVIWRTVWEMLLLKGV